ncbi:hypothetical protein [Streptomyces sp. A0642]|uniref:hypothetical protein n=1 Tax=Streptomyces sp. A0642 TaxID=2563100 RepID=UPI0019D2DDC3|nr:hypothetical protein [Streptomyces sp. A0642]
MKTRAARALTDGVDPKNVIVALCLLVGARYGWPGIGWGLLAITFCAGIPIAYIVIREGDGRWGNRHLTDRSRRMVVIPVILASVGICLAAMSLGGAPAPMLSMVAAMLVTLAAIWPITRWWKISVHTSVLTGALAMLGLLYGPWWLLSIALVPMVAWSRAQLKDHTPWQTVAGAALGAIVAGPVFALGL